MSQSVVVIGGSGFLGKVVVGRLLDAGIEVVNLDIKPSGIRHRCLTEYPADIAAWKTLSPLRLPTDSQFVHLAGRQYAMPVRRGRRQAYFDAVNLTGTKNVAELALASRARTLVYVSTDMVYGKPDYVPIAVDHPRRPIGEYGASKVAGEDICLGLAAEKVRVCVMRPRLIVGPGRLGLLSKLFANIARDWPVPMIGTGANRYQMISVHDCAAAISMALANEKAEGAFNLGSDPGSTSRELLAELIDAAGSRSRLVPVPSGILKPMLRLLDRFGVSPLVPEQFEIADIDYVVDTSRTKDVLGWSPKFTDREMMIAAYREFEKPVQAAVGKRQAI